MHGEENKKERAKVRKRITAQRAKVRVATRISAQERERERERERGEQAIGIRLEKEDSQERELCIEKKIKRRE